MFLNALIRKALFVCIKSGSFVGVRLACSSNPNGEIVNVRRIGNKEDDGQTWSRTRNVGTSSRPTGAPVERPTPI